ncbi:MAG TPA: TIGR03000 domain-containing protein [Gemmataceae bacterium]|jgi:uncharacterized protein (TIGR03000 family)|nr:TIGR03000 domain-containing protein [Gemmataceae bacterium]
MYATVILLAVSGPQLAPGQFPGTQHPTVWYYNSHNVPVPWPANRNFEMTMDNSVSRTAVSSSSSYYYSPPQGVTSWSTPAPGPAPATLVVHLPPGARLTIDGYPPRATGETRWFITPHLEPGRTFHYDLKAEVERGGKRLTRTQEVAVQAGQRTDVTINFPET